MIRFNIRELEASSCGGRRGFFRWEVRGSVLGLVAAAAAAENENCTQFPVAVAASFGS